MSNLWVLVLDFNKLTRVRQNWFSGLKRLYALTLSNNNIVRVDAGSFKDLTSLEVLNLQSNQLQTVDPDWFSGLQNLLELRLESNHIPHGAFQYLHDLRDLTLSGNFPFLDGETFWGLRNSPSQLRVVGKRLGRVRDTVVRDVAWSLSLHNHKDGREPRHIRRQDVSLTISDYFLCITHDPLNNKQTFRWAYNLSTYHDPRSVTIVNTSCGLPDILLTKIKSQADSVVLMKTGPSYQHTHPDDSAQCRQGWEQNGGLTVALQSGLRLRLNTLSERNATIRAFTLTLDRTTQNTSKNSSDTEGNLKTFIQTNVTNVTCFVLANGNANRLELNFRQDDQMRYNKTCPDSGQCPSSLQTTLMTNRTEVVLTSQNQTTAASTPQVSTIVNGPASDDVSIYVAISLLPLFALGLVLIVSMLKRLVILRNKGDRANTVPPAKPGRARSASLPAIPHRQSVVPHSLLVSCRSLPTTLSSIEPNYCEIPYDTVHAHHTYWEIQDAGMSDVTSSASRSHTRREEREDTVSCQSMPVFLPSVKPTYYNIPKCNGVDESPLPFYGIAVDLTLPTVMGQGENRSIYHGRHPKRSRHLSLRKTRYGRSKSHRVTFYGKAVETSSEHGSLGRSSRRVQQTSRRHTAVYGRSKSHGVTFHGKTANVLYNWGMRAEAKTPGSNSQSTLRKVDQSVSGEDAASPTSRPHTWQIVEGGCHLRSAKRPTSLTEQTCVMELQRRDGENTPRQTSFATPHTNYCRSLALPNYRPLDISSGLCTLRRRASLPSLNSTCTPGTSEDEVTLNKTPTNAKKPGEIPNSLQSIASRLQPPISIVTNTYWPWEIASGRNPGQLKRTHHIACDEGPSQINTYWPWEIPTVKQTTIPHLPKTTQANSRTFIHTAVDIWNSLPDNVVGRITDNNLQSFKTRASSFHHQDFCM
ncbi:hypothetical protein Bbelb_064270 [Branchiostoma belcheri]|nr:hypothetical protein Bbelb_064270 [Branchiostoma belcheri]